MREIWFIAVAFGVLLAVTTVGAVALVIDEGTGEVWSPPEPDIYTSETPDEPGEATIGDRTFDRLQAALDAAKPGDRVRLEGRFESRVTIDTPGIEVTTVDGASAPAVIDGAGEGSVVTIDAPAVTLSEVRIENSGVDRSAPDAAVMVNGSDATIDSIQITNSLFGIWIDGVPDVTVNDSTIIGPAETPISERGNGIHLWEAAGAELTNNDITQVRDGIYFQWSSGVVASDNRLWNLRYGVHYMYSDDNRLVDNLAFDNDVGFALMVSENLTIDNNIAIDNRGTSSHGILVKGIDHSELRGNEVINNGQGFYVYNSHDNDFEDNLIMENDLGIQFTAGSSKARVVGNSFMYNDRAVLSTAVVAQLAWNDSGRGNYWSDARAIDIDGDGTSEVRYQPTGIVEQLVYERPETAVFAESPAFDAVRLAESSFPIIQSPGVVDHHPLTQPNHDHWRSYYAN